MAIDIEKIDLAMLKSRGEEILWETQKDYERCIKEEANARDLYGKDMIAHQKAMSESYASFVGREKTVTTAKKLAEGDCNGYYAAMINSEQRKKKFKILGEALKERIQTIKKIVYGDEDKLN